MPTNGRPAIYPIDSIVCVKPREECEESVPEDVPRALCRILSVEETTIRFRDNAPLINTWIYKVDLVFFRRSGVPTYDNGECRQVYHDEIDYVCVPGCE